jgi:hypothetical protein
MGAFSVACYPELSIDSARYPRRAEMSIEVLLNKHFTQNCD